MGGFFKKFFKDGNNSDADREHIKLMDNLVNEIIAEEEIRSSETSHSAKEFHNTPEGAAAEDNKSFSCYKFQSLSHIGMVKESNQDSIFTGEFKCHTNDGVINIGMGIVADGMGGLSMGETASITAIGAVTTFMYTRISEYFQYGLPNTETILTHMNNAIQNANAMVKDKGDSIGEVLGTTFTMVLLIGNMCYFGHVGDSRAYILDREEDTIEKVTRDHSLVGRMIELGELTEKEAKSHPRRNEIYRMLGVRDNVEVETYIRTINENSIITLVSDGLWEFVDDDEIKEMVGSMSFTKAAKALVQEANNNGGEDNISVILIKPERSEGSDLFKL